ncbi:HIRA-interacting protein 3 isoform X3 [Bicyclus anynana]|uniref:HIRA-interacting protein 3 isoform X3 n=1 Tax=Bicyclus anynana TaxID=110368 RepID=A0A6J1MLD3_BICAN|nr:HIRA-interacting protein 3 isoform X3 [Bicyclus anynana]
MNYEAERAMNQKRLRMEGEPGHGVVQGNGLPLNYIDNGHQIPYQPYASAYNTHYPPPDAFAAYGPPPPGGYAPQNLSYAPPAHQNYAHHQSFPPQQPTQAQIHMAQSHMVQGYGDVGLHKASWPPQPHLLPPLDTQKPLDIKQLKPEIKLEPTDTHKRPHPENEMMNREMEQPKIKIKTDIFKPDELVQRTDADKPRESALITPADLGKTDLSKVDDVQTPRVETDKPVESAKPEGSLEAGKDSSSTKESTGTPSDKSEEDRKPFSSPESAKMGFTPGKVTPGLEGSTNKPKPPGTPTKLTPPTPGAMTPRGPPPPVRSVPVGRPRAPSGYQYAIRPFRKDFSGIQFRRRWSDDCLDSSHIPNEVYFGDVPVPLPVLYNYYDANAERERLATQAAQIAAQKAAAAKLAAAKLQARGVMSNEVTTVDSSSSDDSSGSSESGSEESDDDMPLKRGPGRPKAAKSPKTPGTPGKRGRPPVPPELRQPGITDMKKFCKAAGIRFDYKKLVEGCTKNKERVSKMHELLVNAGLEGKPTLEKCKALKKAKMDKKEQEKQAKKEAKVTKHKDTEGEEGCARRMTRGATGVKPRQRIVISSDEEDGTPAARRTLSKLRSSVNDESDSD